MLDFLLHHLVYPTFWFVFEFVGDRPWLAAIIVGLIAILVWRFLWPLVMAFHTLFGWKGWALLAAGAVTFGAFGAGWRAHRDSIYPVPHSDDPPPKKRPKPKPKRDTDEPDHAVIFPDGDNFLKKIFRR